MPYNTCNNKDICNNIAKNNTSTNKSDSVCFFNIYTTLFANCFCPQSPPFSQNTILSKPIVSIVVNKM